MEKAAKRRATAKPVQEMKKIISLQCESVEWSMAGNGPIEL